MPYSRRYNDSSTSNSQPSTMPNAQRFESLLPLAPLRSSVALAVALGALGTAGLGLIAASWIDAGPAYLVKSLGIFAVAATLVVGLVGPHHPFPRFGPANHVTLVRVALVSIAAGLVGEPRSARVTWLAVAATITVVVLDGLDGWLARRSRVSSAFGARFDMETDALLILVLSVLVWQHGKAGAWILACGLMRYAFVACGWLLPWMAGPLRSTVRGKAVAIGQLVGLGAVLSPLVPAPQSAVVAAATLAMLVWSFAVDVMWLYRSSR